MKFPLIVERVKNGATNYIEYVEIYDADGNAIATQLNTNSLYELLSSLINTINKSVQNLSKELLISDIKWTKLNNTVPKPQSHEEINDIATKYFASNRTLRIQYYTAVTYEKPQWVDSTSPSFSYDYIWRIAPQVYETYEGEMAGFKTVKTFLVGSKEHNLFMKNCPHTCRKLLHRYEIV